MSSWRQTFTLALCLSGAFLAGQWLPRPTLEAQGGGGRGPVNPSPSEPHRPPGINPTPTSSPGAAQPGLVYGEDGSHTAAANGFLAVTGSYGVGTSVLYLIDTNTRQLAIYEARGGSAEQRRVVFVGARRIDLDLQLEGYNDRSEYDYRKLRDAFEKRGSKGGEVGSGLVPSDEGHK